MPTPIPKVDIFNVDHLRFRRRLSVTILAVMFIAVIVSLYHWRVTRLEKAVLDQQIAQLNESYQQRTNYLTGLIEVLEGEFFGKKAVNLTDEQKAHLADYRQRLEGQKEAIEKEQLSRKIRFIGKHVSEPSANRIAQSIWKWSRVNKIDPDMLAALVYVESRFKPASRSHKGAVGVSQVMPNWVGCKNPRSVCRKLSFLKNTSDLEDVDNNIRAGALILDYYLKLAKGNWDQALASYNMGWGRVDKDLSEGKDLDYLYAKKVLRVYTRLKQSGHSDGPELVLSGLNQRSS